MKVVPKPPEPVEINKEFLLGHLYKNSARLYLATTDNVVDVVSGVMFNISYIDPAYYIDVTDDYCIKEER